MSERGAVDLLGIHHKSLQSVAVNSKYFGFTCSAGDDIAIKKDITQFLNIPESTLNSFLRKHQNDIQPIKLYLETIRSFGGKASRMNGYHLDDVSKIALGKLMLVLECNGYCHRYYDAIQEKQREKLITQKYSLVRFHHQISLETLFNGILQAKLGTMVKLYDLEQLGQEIPFNTNPINAQIA